MKRDDMGLGDEGGDEAESVVERSMWSGVDGVRVVDDGDAGVSGVGPRDSEVGAEDMVEDGEGRMGQMEDGEVDKQQGYIGEVFGADFPTSAPQVVTLEDIPSNGVADDLPEGIPTPDITTAIRTEEQVDSFFRSDLIDPSLIASHTSLPAPQQEGTTSPVTDLGARPRSSRVSTLSDILPIPPPSTLPSPLSAAGTSSDARATSTPSPDTVSKPLAWPPLLTHEVLVPGKSQPSLRRESREKRPVSIPALTDRATRSTPPSHAPATLRGGGEEGGYQYKRERKDGVQGERGGLPVRNMSVRLEEGASSMRERFGDLRGGAEGAYRGRGGGMGIVGGGRGRGSGRPGMDGGVVADRQDGFGASRGGDGSVRGRPILGQSARRIERLGGRNGFGVGERERWGGGSGSGSGSGSAGTTGREAEGGGGGRGGARFGLKTR
jgi:hypothetical protein